MLSGTWSLAISAAEVGASFLPTGGVQVLTAAPKISALQTFTFGTGPGQANLSVMGSAVLAASGTATINLNSGAVDIFGQPAVFGHLLGFAAWISAGGDSSGAIIEPGASNPCNLWWQGTGPGELMYPGGPGFVGGAGIAAGATVGAVAVTSGACNIKFVNSSSAVGVTIQYAGIGTTT